MPRSHLSLGGEVAAQWRVRGPSGMSDAVKGAHGVAAALMDRWVPGSSPGMTEFVLQLAPSKHRRRHLCTVIPGLDPGTQ